MNKQTGPIARELGGGAPPAEDIRAEYENSLEYQVGCTIVDALTEAYGLSAEEAAAMLGANVAPSGAELIALRAAEVLAEMEKAGRLSRPPEDYMRDEAFLSLIGELPAELAVRVADAEAAAQNAGARAENERSAGAEEVIESLRARRALPKPIRSGMSAGAAQDFHNMTSEEFAEFKRRYFKA